MNKADFTRLCTMADDEPHSLSIHVDRDSITDPRKIVMWGTWCGGASIQQTLQTFTYVGQFKTGRQRILADQDRKIDKAMAKYQKWLDEYQAVHNLFDLVQEERAVIRCMSLQTKATRQKNFENLGTAAQAIAKALFGPELNKGRGMSLPTERPWQPKKTASRPVTRR